MQEFIGFKDCQTGQRVKMKGKGADHGVFAAHSITLTEAEDQAVMEGLIQNIEYEKNILRILDHEVVLPSEVTIKDLLRNLISLQELKVGNRLKLIGKCSDSKQFVPAKIKIKETDGFNIAELQGVIDKIDRAKSTLEVLGFTVVVDERTMFYGS